MSRFIFLLIRPPAFRLLLSAALSESSLKLRAARVLRSLCGDSLKLLAVVGLRNQSLGLDGAAAGELGLLMRGALQTGSALTTLAPASRRHGSKEMIALVQYIRIHAATGVAPLATAHKEQQLHRVSQHRSKGEAKRSRYSPINCS